LLPFAQRHGPTKAEIAQPLDLATLPADVHKCPAFAPGNRRAA
jgi:hypothetical protein